MPEPTTTTTRTGLVQSRFPAHHKLWMKFFDTLDDASVTLDFAGHSLDDAATQLAQARAEVARTQARFGELLREVANLVGLEVDQGAATKVIIGMREVSKMNQALMQMVNAVECELESIGVPVGAASGRW